MGDKQIDLSKIDRDDLKLLISKSDINYKVKNISRELTKKFKDKNPIVICVLNGAFIFFADLVRNLDFDFEIDFIKLSSYGSKMKSSGTVRMIKDISADVTNRDVIIVEDIIDTGLTINYLRKRMLDAGVNSISFATCLLKKRKTYKFDFKIDYIGFKIPDRFVIGYGLDLDQRFRGLDSIYTLK
tara:strand:+ start:277 stop:831 length:555 start_codon:yes stop_codon:yes gene_type:complete